MAIGGWGEAARVAAAAATLAAAAFGAATAQTVDEQTVLEQFDAQTPVTVYDGGAITLGDLISERQALGELVTARMNDEELYVSLLLRVERRRLLAEAARRDGLDILPEIDERVRRAVEDVLAASYVERNANLSPTQQELRELYDSVVPKTEATRIRQIVADSLEDALAVQARLAAGETLEAVAAERRAAGAGGESLQGGELLVAATDPLAPGLGAAAAALDIGALSDPVETRFGWHVFVVEGRETVADGPSFAEAAPSLREIWIQREADAVIGAVRPSLGAGRPGQRPPFDAIRRDDLLPQ